MLSQVLPATLSALRNAVMGNGRILCLEQFWLRQYLLPPDGGTNHFPRVVRISLLRRATGVGSHASSLSGRHRTNYGSSFFLRAGPGSTSVAAWHLPCHTLLLRAFQTKIVSVDLNRPLGAVNPRYLRAPASIVRSQTL